MNFVAWEQIISSEQSPRNQQAQEALEMRLILRHQGTLRDIEIL